MKKPAYPCIFVAAFPRDGDPVILDTYGPPVSRVVNGVTMQWDNVVDHEVSELSTCVIGKNVGGHDIAVGYPTAAKGLYAWMGAVQFTGDPGDEGVKAIWRGQWLLVDDRTASMVAHATWRQYIAALVERDDGLKAEWKLTVARTAFLSGKTSS